ncbi:MAG: septum formation initiator, partial [Pseudonocardiales bacterium]|nr:septum formation initiator [Pseudonocardiales bacterium]
MARRGLVMVSDPDLLDAVLRIGAAAGCEIERVADAVQARRSWSRAPVVLLDAPAARQCTQAGLPRRGGVIVAARGEPPPAVWQQAVAVGAEHVVSLPDAERWLVAALSEAVDEPAGAGAAVGVLGGRGGAGASVLAAAVAVTAGRDGGRARRAAGAPRGGGPARGRGAEDLDGMRWPQVGVGGGRVPAAALHAALPAPAVGRR